MSICGAQPLTSDATEAITSRLFADAVEMPFTAGTKAQLPISLRPGRQMVLGLRLTAPRVNRAEALTTHLVLRDTGDGQITSGYTVLMHIQ